MRLYIKLLAIVLIAAAFQWWVKEDWRRNELWFGLRCAYANVVHDPVLHADLEAEADVLVARMHEADLAGTRNASGCSGGSEGGASVRWEAVDGSSCGDAPGGACHPEGSDGDPRDVGVSGRAPSRTVSSRWSVSD